MKTNLFFNFIYYVVESFLLGSICQLYIGEKPLIKRLLLFSLTFGILIFILREILTPIYKIPFGSHVFILAFINFFLLKVFFNHSFSLALICDFLYFATIFIVESLGFSLLSIFKILPWKILNKEVFLDFLRIICCTLLIFLVIVLRRTNFVLLPLKKTFGEKFGE